jgi:hypothetical protein
METSSIITTLRQSFSKRRRQPFHVTYLHGLKLAGLVSVTRKANWRLYSVKHNQVCQILASAQELLKEEFKREGESPS